VHIHRLALHLIRLISPASPSMAASRNRIGPDTTCTSPTSPVFSIVASKATSHRASSNQVARNTPISAGRSILRDDPHRAHLGAGNSQQCDHDWKRPHVPVLRGDHSTRTLRLNRDLHRVRLRVRRQLDRLHRIL
jgi:hypothetical protein